MISACLPLSRKYSAIAVAAYGAKNCIGAGSEAVAATTTEYSIAPLSLASSPTVQLLNAFGQPQRRYSKAFCCRHRQLLRYMFFGLGWCPMPRLFYQFAVTNDQFTLAATNRDHRVN